MVFSGGTGQEPSLDPDSDTLREQVSGARAFGESTPFEQMQTGQIVAASVVGAIALVFAVFALLLHQSAVLRGWGTDYFVAFGALSTAIAAAFTIVGSIVAAAYVGLTYLLWKQAAVQSTLQKRASETAFMQQLMVEYDGLRDSVLVVQTFYERHPGQGAARDAFRQWLTLGRQRTAIEDADNARFRISRFFVRIRKLALEGYVERKLVAVALGRAAIEDVFLELIDPLDQVISEQAYGRPNVIDRDFFRGLLDDFNLRRPGVSEMTSSRHEK